MDAMLVLGSYVFGLNTAAFQELNRDTKWRWGKQEVFGDVPALQFVGYGEETITLPGVIFPEYWGGTGQLDTLRSLADQGQPLPLIDGRGYVLGDFVITGVQERQSTFAGMGVPLRQEFTITLERDRMGETPAAGGGIAGARIANDNAATASGADAGSIVGDAGAASSSALGALGASAAAIQNLVGTVSVPLDAALGAVNQAMGAARNLQTAARNARATLAAVGALKSRAGAQSALAGLLRSGNEVSQSAASAARVIQSTVGTMSGESAGAVATVRSAMATAGTLATAASKIRARASDFVDGFAS